MFATDQNQQYKEDELLVEPILEQELLHGLLTSTNLNHDWEHARCAQSQLLFLSRY